MAELIIRERCAEESDSFIESLVNLMVSINEGKTGLKVSKDIASRKARDLTKCIVKGDEPYGGW